MMKKSTIRVTMISSKSVLFSIFLVSSLCSTVFGQYNGYLGKKNVVDLFTNMYTPAYSNGAFSSYQEYLVSRREGNRLVAQKDRFDFGIRIGVAHSFSSKFAIGFEAGYDYYSVQRSDRQIYYLLSSSIITHEALDIRHFTFMPKLIFSGNGSLQPMGISHQIGFGFNRINVADKSYSYEEEFYGGSEVSSKQFSENEILFDKMNAKNYQKPKSFTLMYALNMRTPLSKSLFLTYGLRYQVHFTPMPNFKSYGEGKDEYLPIDEYELASITKARKQRNLLQAQIGIAFAF